MVLRHGMAVGAVLVLMAATVGAQSSFAGKQQFDVRSNTGCEFACQIDAGSCDHSAETPGEHRACANEHRRCLARCEGRAGLRSRHRR